MRDDLVLVRSHWFSTCIHSLSLKSLDPSHREILAPLPRHDIRSDRRGMGRDLQMRYRCDQESHLHLNSTIVQAWDSERHSFSKQISYIFIDLPTISYDFLILFASFCLHYLELFCRVTASPTAQKIRSFPSWASNVPGREEWDPQSG